MGQYRTYFSKDNVIIKGKKTNTGLNPILKLVHGSGDKLFSRVIFSFDIDTVKNKITDKSICNNIKHTLNITNTVSYDKTNINELKDFEHGHASSYDLVLFKVPEFWDEGVGYDYDFSKTAIDLGGKVLNTASNYTQRTSTLDWSEQGIYSGTTSSKYEVLKTIHFDLGNENIKVDISDFINTLITGTTENFYGLGLAFVNELETATSDILYTVDFYGKDTHTFFEPFIETTWDDIVKDDRNNFYYDKINKLYLYSNINKNPTNLDELPIVTILDSNGDDILSPDVVQEGKGVYSVTFELSSSDYDNEGLINFYDVWSNIKMNGRNLNDIEMEFTLKQNNYFNIGNEIYEPKEFAFNFTGIQRGEKIEKGEIRKVIVTVREFYNNDVLIVDNIYYLIYVKQGNSKIIVTPKTKINMGFNQNYFYLDTSWMISQDYFIDIIVESNGTVTKKSDIGFTILDNKSDNSIM